MLTNRTPMRRGGFKRRELPPRAPIVLARASRPSVYVPAQDLVLAVPKGIRARPGKRAPTAEERAWMDALVAFGCVACWLDGLGRRPCAVHHLLRGGQRIGHLHTIGLCDPGHHQNGQALGFISRHPWKARFEARYGTEAELLALLQKEIRS